LAEEDEAEGPRRNDELGRRRGRRRRRAKEREETLVRAVGIVGRVADSRCEGGSDLGEESVSGKSGVGGLA
jgi:hypothetical protein